MADDTYKHLVAVISIEASTVFPVILLNVLVIFAVATRRTLRTNSNILLASLAGTDLFSGLVTQPLAIAVSVNRALDVGRFCTLEKAFAISLFGAGVASLGHLFVISIDRYIAIKEPLRYRDIVTKRRTKTAVLIVWGIAALLTIEEIVLAALDSERNIYLRYVKVTDIILSTLASLCIGGILYTYGYIFTQTRRQRKRLKIDSLSQEEVKRIKKDNKASNTLAIILGTLVLTYLPAIITLLLSSASANITEPRVLCIVWTWVLTFVLTGSLGNPVIYCWRKKKLRHAFLEILHLRQPENRPPEIEMQVIERHRPQVPGATSEAFSRSVATREPVLLSFRHLQADEIIPTAETDQHV